MDTRERYLAFAEVEAAGSSATYERLALAVADSPAVLDLLDRAAAVEAPTEPGLRRRSNPRRTDVRSSGVRRVRRSELGRGRRDHPDPRNPDERSCPYRHDPAGDRRDRRPGRTDRGRLLRRAVPVPRRASGLPPPSSRREPTELLRGDLEDTLDAALALVPDGATPIVFHSAVLYYVSGRPASIRRPTRPPRRPRVGLQRGPRSRGRPDHQPPAAGHGDPRRVLRHRSRSSGRGDRRHARQLDQLGLTTARTSPDLALVRRALVVDPPPMIPTSTSRATDLLAAASSTRCFTQHPPGGPQ